MFFNFEIDNIIVSKFEQKKLKSVKFHQPDESIF